MGPKGRSAILDQSYGVPRITKDGVTVAKSIEFSNKFQNMGAQLVRQVNTGTAVFATMQNSVAVYVNIQFIKEFHTLFWGVCVDRATRWTGGAELPSGVSLISENTM